MPTQHDAPHAGASITLLSASEKIAGSPYPLEIVD